MSGGRKTTDGGNVDDRAARRVEIARAIDAARQDRGFDRLVGRVVLVALPDDPMSMVFERLKRYRRGPVSVVTMENNEFRISRRVRRQHAAEVDEPVPSCPIHPDTYAVMWMAYLRVVDGPVVCYQAPAFNMELVDRERVSVS